MYDEFHQPSEDFQYGPTKRRGRPARTKSPVEEEEPDNTSIDDLLQRYATETGADIEPIKTEADQAHRCWIMTCNCKNNIPLLQQCLVRFIHKFQIWNRQEGLEGATIQCEKGLKKHNEHVQAGIVWKIGSEKTFKWLCDEVEDIRHANWKFQPDVCTTIRYGSKPKSRMTQQWAGPHIIGSIDKEQGKRNDIGRFFVTAMTKNTSAAIEENPNLWTLGHKFKTTKEIIISDKINETRCQRVRQDLTLLLGRPGGGKTQWAAENKYEPEPMDYFYGTHEPRILIDEYQGGPLCGLEPQHVLAKLDAILTGYPHKAPTKGGYITMRPDSIAIATNVHPVRWMSYVLAHTDIRAAFERRITRILVFEDPTKPPTPFNSIHDVLINMFT